ncbi:MAG: type II secretion system protein J, partial [Pseudobdellovibrionaceae bacterium]
SLIEVMITVLILGVIGAAMSSMLTSMSKENRGLSEKLASLDLLRQVSQILASNSLCNSMLASGNTAGGTGIPFNPGSITTTNTPSINLKSIPMGLGVTLVEVGKKVSALSQSLFVEDSAGGIKLFVVGGSPPVGKLVITFDQSKLVRPIKNIETLLELTLTGPAGSKTITGCKGAGGSGGGPGGYQVFTTSGSFVVPPEVTEIYVEAWGAGGGGSGTGNGGFYPCAPGAGGGGGGGGYAFKKCLVTPGGAPINYVVGLGGAGGDLCSNGVDGGDSMFGTCVGAYGGKAGRFGVGVEAGGLITGGLGGEGYLGDANLKGTSGSNVYGGTYSGGGGGSANGGAGGHWGMDGAAPGGGGGGGNQGNNAASLFHGGGKGGDGMIKIRW